MYLADCRVLYWLWRPRGYGRDFQGHSPKEVPKASCHTDAARCEECFLLLMLHFSRGGLESGRTLFLACRHVGEMMLDAHCRLSRSTCCWVCESVHSLQCPQHSCQTGDFQMSTALCEKGSDVHVHVCPYREREHDHDIHTNLQSMSMEYWKPNQVDDDGSVDWIT